MCENVVSSALAALSLEEEAATSKAGKVIRNSAHQAADELPGMHDVLEALEQALAWPSRYADLASQLGVRWPKGILLHGPPGCGKTAAVLAVARQCDAVVHVVTAASIVGAFTGESERRLREAFAAAAKDAASGRCVVIFLDEVDALCPKRSSAGQHEARIVGQLLTLLDGSTALGPSQQNASPQGGGLQGAAPGHILVVGTTSRPNAVDPALRRPGRLEREILVGMPDASARASILRLLTQKLPLDETVNLQRLAETTHGYTGADLRALCREAAMCAVSASAAGAAQTAESANTQQPSRRGLPGADIPPPAPGKSSPDADHGEDSTAAVDTQQNDGHVLRQLSAADFAAATKRVGPSMARGSAVEYEATSWDDIGGLDEVKQRLKQAVEWPLRHAGAFKRLGLTPPRGVLLHGPPGCSKTTLVRAAASASGATFISLSGAQLYSMYVGEGEALLRETFRRARLVAPAIVFFDELDSLVGKRVEGEQTGEVTARILSSFLTEMDGLELAQGVLVMGATNRPQALDTALVRPGRFDVVLYVPPPDEAGRLHALQIHSRSIPLAADVDLSSIAAATDCYTGAELAAICREAAMAALREGGHNAKEVHQRHFQAALAGLQPHLNETELSKYENLGRR